jgi:hypothetical protein
VGETCGDISITSAAHTSENQKKSEARNLCRTVDDSQIKKNRKRETSAGLTPVTSHKPVKHSLAASSASSLAAAASSGVTPG